MRSKGFTLIELLAVIVILAIIALIATPIILGIIEDSKKNINIRSTELYIDALQTTIASKNMQSAFRPSECIITNKITTCDGVKLNVVTKETMPTSGTIKFENGKVISAALDFNGQGVVLNNGKYEEAETFTVTYTNIDVLDTYPTTIVKTGDLSINIEKTIEFVKINNEEVTNYTLENGIFTLKNVQGNVEIIGELPVVQAVTEDTKTFGNVPTGQFNEADEYIIKVKPGLFHHFFVLNSTEDKVKLITGYNIAADGTQATDTNPSLVAWGKEKSSYFGPCVAMQFLHDATSNWDNISYITMDYSGSYGSYGYGAIKTTGTTTKIRDGSEDVVCTFVGLRASIPTLEDLNGYCVGYNMYIDGLLPYQYANITTAIPGYWTLQSGNSSVRYISAGGTLSSTGNANIATVGVRPVIELPKTYFESM